MIFLIDLVWSDTEYQKAKIQPHTSISHLRKTFANSLECVSPSVIIKFFIADGSSLQKPVSYGDMFYDRVGRIYDWLPWDMIGWTGDMIGQHGI